MSVLNIPCPKCGFSLFVTNHQILGRPARCPDCRFKFILEAPSAAATTDSAQLRAADEETVASQDLLVDMGRTYVTMEQIIEWHPESEQSAFLQWIVNRSTTLAAGGMGFFFDDYEEWLRLGKPCPQTGFDDSHELCVGKSCIIRHSAALQETA